MARARNPRRMALDMLRNIKRNVGAMVSRWDQDQRVYDPAGYRPRRDDEKIENQIAEWAHLVKYLDAIIDEADQARWHAQRQIVRLRGGAA